MKRMRIALAKGRLAEKSVNLFIEAGYQLPDDIFTSRKLIFQAVDDELELILVKAADVPCYVEYGAADMGIVGKDTLLEAGRSLYEVLDLNFGRCKFALAGPPGREESPGYQRIATKYPNFAREYFKEKSQPIEIIQLTGSIELAPLTGLAELILDIVESGRTLRENGLIIYQEICSLSARLVVNRVSMKTRRQEINEVIGRLRDRVERGGFL